MRKLMPFVSLVCLLSAAVAGARESIVFVEAHPDDLPGHLGTALRLSEKFDVHVIDFTHGERGCGWEKFTNGWTKATRTAEETEVCRRAGFTLHWCDEVNGFAYAGSNVCAQIAAYLKEINPRAVFCHWPIDTHIDHVLSTAATMKALELAKLKPECYFHEQVTQSRGFQAVYRVEVGSCREKKAELTRLYVCQDGDAIAARKATAGRVYAWQTGRSEYIEIFGVMSGTVRPGHSVFDSLTGVSY